MMLSSDHFNKLYQDLHKIKEWQESASLCVSAIQSQLNLLNHSSNKLSDKVEQATQHVETGKQSFAYHDRRYNYLQFLSSLFKKVSDVEGKLNKKETIVAWDLLAKDLKEVSVKVFTAPDGSKISEPNKALLKSLTENVKRTSDDACDRFATSSFVTKLLPIMGKIMKQHVLRSSDIEQKLGSTQQMDENLQQAMSIVRAASILDSTSSSLSMVNVGATARIQKLYLSQINSALSKSTDEIVASCLSTLKSNNNTEAAFGAYLIKFYSLVENTWSLSFLLFGKDNINTFETTRKFLFQNLNGEGELEGNIQTAIQSTISSVFDSHFSDFFKKITKKSAPLKTAMEMLYALYNFYGDPASISFYPLRVFQKEEGKHANANTWLIKHFSNQYPLIEFAKYFIKTVDSSPPANVSDYLEEQLNDNDATVVIDKLQLLLRSVSLLILISSTFTYQPDPKEVLNDLLTNAISVLGEVPTNVSKNVGKSIQKFLSFNQSLLTLQNQDISHLSSVINFLDLETIAIYKQFMPDVISSLNSTFVSSNSTVSSSSSRERKKSQFQDLI